MSDSETTTSSRRDRCGQATADDATPAPPRVVCSAFVRPLVWLWRYLRWRFGDHDIVRVKRSVISRHTGSHTAGFPQSDERPRTTESNTRQTSQTSDCSQCSVSYECREDYLPRRK